MNSSTTNIANDDEPASSSTRLLLLLILCGALFCGFWLVDHTPFASEHYNPHGDIMATDNRTADRIQKVNKITAPARLFVALLGIGFLFLKPPGRLRTFSPVMITAAMFLGFVFASVIWSENPGVTIHKCVVLACFGVAAFALARQLTMEELTTVFVLICLGFIAVGFFAELLLGNFTPYKKDYRFVGTAHPNSLGAYGGFCCLVSIVYFSYRPKIDPWLIVIFGIGFGVLLLTRSRTALAGLMAGLAAVWFIKINPNQRVLVVSSSLLLLVAAVMALTLARSNVRASVAGKLAMGRTTSVSTLTGRLPLWEELLSSVEKRPLIGHGYLAFWDKEQIEILQDTLRWEVPHGHNIYIDWMLDVGLIGFFLFLLMFATAGITAFYRATVLLDRHAMIVAGFLTFTFVHGFAESLFKLPTFLAFMVATLTLRMAMSYPTEKHDDGRTNDLSLNRPKSQPLLRPTALIGNGDVR